MRIPTSTSCENFYLGKNTWPSLFCLLVEEWHRNSCCLLGSSSWETNYADCCECDIKVVGSSKSKSTRRVVGTATRLFIPNERGKPHSRLHTKHKLAL